jgi:hypothetical protein
MQTDAPLQIGPLRLTVDPDRARAYAIETGGDGATAPLAYPAVWLTEPRLAEVVNGICADLDVVPVHESQTFSYDSPLVAGESYDVIVALRREETPPRLIADATIVTTTGAPAARIETMLRLVPRAGLQGAEAEGNDAT